MSVPLLLQERKKFKTQKTNVMIRKIKIPPKIVFYHVLKFLNANR